MIPLYDEKRINKFPLVTIVLVILNVYLFFLSLNDINFYFNTFAFSYNNLFNGNLYTVFTSLFLHGNIFHLFGNVLFLWVFGKSIEAKIGSARFLFFYLLCGLFSVLTYALIEDRASYLIGASGAISGVLGAYLMLFPRNKIRAIVPIVVFWTTASIPAFVFIIIWFLVQIFSLGTSDMVAYSSHVGGFISGLIFIKSFVKR
jgi:membrane associated rhomboid family serine protease